MRRSCGFALLEVVLAASVVVGATIVVMRSLDSSARSALVSSARHDLTAGLERALESVRADFEYGGLSTLAVVEDDAVAPMQDGIEYDNVQCAAVVNVTSAGVEHGPVVSYQFELEAGELPDGIDNDGDGIADEGILVRIDPRGRQVLRSGVTAARFVKSTDELSCTLTLAESRPAGGVLAETQRLVLTIVND
ncbi:MAG: hypothetical protein U1E76_22325 [Planctomycetota bacterium]